MKKKIIGITSNIVTCDTKPFIGSKKLRLYAEYVDAIIDAGGIPMIIPTNTNREVMAEQITLVDGLLISGGYDIDPLRYGQEPSSKVHDISIIRDECEFYLLEKATERKIPVLGICRGHQLINVFNGGDLYQDLSFIEGSYIKHWQESTPAYGSHSVDIMKNTILNEILGDEAIVNSYHHLAVKTVAPGFKISALSRDGVIEAIEKEGEPFIMGIQWHPEVISRTYPKMNDIFKYFISHC